MTEACHDQAYDTRAEAEQNALLFIDTAAKHDYDNAQGCHIQHGQLV
eukprot:CAMPEP_0197666038 /NCGR_PEP_ID=MMETSP1338-20131121/61332_1 /TAXON_ID=43686 ORGANISM="Pelagodinium beii, Strain RCC1491" /NCGR_SAMPLE_ID=MMETSP1338 /ASSEMBLY_ACC=CAM_ASM_000754 /LENGTH=46 /DNA_ID= /DNA_START= /DNA_END= /DNA_ORIENTATION=